VQVTADEGDVANTDKAATAWSSVSHADDRRFLEAAFRDSTSTEVATIEKLVAKGMITFDRAYRVWSEMLGLSYHSLEEHTLDPRFRYRLPIDLALRHNAVVVAEEDDFLSVALKNPFELLAVDEIQEVTGKAIEVVLATPTAIAKVLELIQKGSSGIEGLIQRLLQSDINSADVDGDKLRELVGDNAVIQLVDHLIEEAIRARASDIHIEPQRAGLRVRIRIDGVLDTLYTLPAGLHRAVVARIKVASGMDIGENRKPQDGRIGVSEKIEMRISVLPSVLGEKAVMRILDRSGITMDPSKIGMTKGNLDQFRRGFSSPNGIVLLTGPTGSGKTTSLYTAMAELNRPESNLVTVEDPVEYELNGATQIQVNAKAERTFSSTLRAILRQDPDIVMVGEIRDADTASIAVQAALTGHVVLSTLHTNDAISTIHRLCDMGIAPYLLGPALRCVVGQRLLPRVCSDCAEPVTPPPELFEEFGVDAEDASHGFKKGVGCQVCRNRGKVGRIAIHEVLTITPALASAISRQASDDQLQKLAEEAGYVRMIQDGLQKAREGLVTLEDVIAAARAE